MSKPRKSSKNAKKSKASQKSKKTIKREKISVTVKKTKVDLYIEARRTSKNKGFSKSVNIKPAILKKYFKHISRNVTWANRKHEAKHPFNKRAEAINKKIKAYLKKNKKKLSENVTVYKGEVINMPNIDKKIKGKVGKRNTFKVICLANIQYVTVKGEKFERYVSQVYNYKKEGGKKGVIRLWKKFLSAQSSKSYIAYIKILSMQIELS